MLALAPPPPAAVAAAAPAAGEIVLTGVLTRADHQTYRLAPFAVPAGTTRLTLDFDYTGREQHAAVDLGLMDPTGLRGWSGGNKRHVVVSATDATPSYRPGPLPAGTWSVLMGVPNLRVGATARYTARIRLDRGPGPVELAEAPISGKPGWYRGDLHLHTAHSDGTCPSQSGARAPCPLVRTVQAAAERHLDFIAITDHNTTAQLNEMRELQPAYDRLLLIPGRELTTFQGHANLFGPAAFVDFRLGSKAVTKVGAMLAAAHREGGVVSINHPAVPSGESCMGCGWTAPDTDFAQVDAVEVVNGGSLMRADEPEGPQSGILFWQARLNAGFRLTAVGGSDNHDATIPLDRRGAVGAPTTVIYAPSLTTAGVLAGLRSGRVFIDVDAPRGEDRFLDLSADGGATSMGALRPSRAGETVRFRLEARAPAGARAEVIVDGAPAPLLADPKVGGDLAFAYRFDGKPHWVRADVHDAAGRLILIGNPIYLRPASP